VGWLVTTRPESERAAIESWLTRCGIEWDRLIMASGSGPARSAAAFKARVYARTNAALLVEGDPDQAAAIAERADRPVFCYATRSMVYPGRFPRQRHVPVRPPHWIERALRRVARLPARIVGRVQRFAARTVGFGAAFVGHAGSLVVL
jgi:orotate phosphoribosyltransferase